MPVRSGEKREDETSYLLRSPANAARLAESVAQIEEFLATLRDAEAKADRDGTFSVEHVVAEMDTIIGRQRTNRRSRRRTS
jgi:hypothetical protein